MRGWTRRRRVVAWSTAGGLVVAGAVVALVLGGSVKPTPADTATTVVARGSVSVQVSASGTVQAAQSRGLSFSMSGTVTEVNVKAGDLVKAGQVLARIDPANAQAAVDVAQDRVSDATDAVLKAEQTAALPACPSATPRASGGAGGGGSGGTGGSGGSGGTGGIGGSGGPPGGSSSVNQSASLRVAAPTATCTQAGRQSVNDPVLSAQQQLNNAQLTLVQARSKLAGTTITAPVAGRVLSVGGKVGSSASPGGTGFVVLGDLSTLGIKAEFSEADVGRLAIGQLVNIDLPGRSPLTGKVSQIDPAGTISSRLVRYGVVIAFDQPPADLLLGQSATVTVTTASASDVLYAASAAVTGVTGGKGSVIIRTASGDETRTVTVGLRSDQYTEIQSGVTAGDVLVLPSAS